eukprot:scaffold3823_cov195-Amphora_coffeaeformis.AAC.14
MKPAVERSMLMLALSVSLLLLAGWNVHEVRATTTPSQHGRFHAPSFLLGKRWHATTTNQRAAIAALSHHSFLHVNRGGGGGAVNGDDDDDNEEGYDDDDNPSDIDDVLAAQESDGEPASPVPKGEINLDDPTLDDEHADAYDEDVEGGEATETTTTTTPAAAVVTSVDDIPTVTAAGQIPLAVTISPAMKKILIKQLKYRPAEVKRMRPEIAAVVVAKELYRPPEGLPTHWLVSQEEMGTTTTRSARVKSIVVSLLTVLIAVVGGTVAASSSSSSSSSSSTPPSLATLYEPPPIPQSDIPEPMDSEPEPKKTPTPAEKLELEKKTTVPPPTPAKKPLLASHDHSLRPGEGPPPHDEPVDETALDKMLTSLEKALGKLFR